MGRVELLGLLLRRFPQAHHSPFGIGEQRQCTHAGHLLLFHLDLASLGDDAFAAGCEVVDVDIERPCCPATAPGAAGFKMPPLMPPFPPVSTRW